jgi:hypothetical protein
MDMKYEKLRELLDAESYPHRYVHKFIGRKTPAFLKSVEELEAEFPEAVKVSSRESAGTSAEPFLALTYELVADTPDEIIDLLEATHQLDDLKIIL